MPTEFLKVTATYHLEQHLPLLISHRTDPKVFRVCGGFGKDELIAVILCLIGQPESANTASSS